MINRIVLNDFLPRENQEDVLLPNPQLQHSQALQKVIDDHVKPGDVVILHGTFNLDKLTGYKPEYYGADGRVISPEVTLNGSQPCISIASHNNTWDFTGCKFIVQRMFNDGIHVREYTGNNVFVNIGSWYTKRILEVDPNVDAATDRGILTRNPAKRWIPPIDANTGFAIKGYANAGFNTTSYKNELSNYRSNAADTSRISTGGGGYGGNYPQDDGSTATTWGSWAGGFYGNFNAAFVVTQNPDLPKSQRESARLSVLAGYIRGWAYAGMEIGTIGDAKGAPRPNMGKDVEKHTVRNVTIKNVVIEDVYESGIQRTNFDNLTIDGVMVTRSGHPDWSLGNAKPERPGVSQVDPGYGTASGRKNQQGKLVIMNSRFVDCNRKGIDAHHGTSTVIKDNFIKAGFWGIQVALEEPQVNRDSYEWEHEVCKYIIKDNEIHAGVRGIDFANGSFGPAVRVAKSLWFMRLSVKIEGNQVHAPTGWYYNYAHDGFILQNNTFIFSMPYGQFYSGGNEASKTYAIFHGTQNATERGIPVADILRGNKVMNSKYGNYCWGVLIQPTALCVLENNFVDVTPWKKKSGLESENEPFISTLDTVYRDNLPTTAFAISKDQITLLQANNYSYNRRSLANSITKLNPETNNAGLEQAAENTSPPEKEIPQGPTITSSDPDTYIFNIPDLEQKGLNPPTGFTSIVASADPLTIGVRLGNGRAAGTYTTTGVYAKAKFPLRSDVTKDTLAFDFKLNRLGPNGVGTVLSWGEESTTGASIGVVVLKGAGTSNAGQYVYKGNGGKTFINGVDIGVNKEYVIPVNTWIHVRVETTIFTNKDYITVGAPWNGNNQCDADFKGLTLYRNKSIGAQLPPPPATSESGTPSESGASGTEGSAP